MQTGRANTANPDPGCRSTGSAESDDARARGPGTPSGINQARRSVSPADLAALGIDLARDFPGQSLADLREYPVLSEGGWFRVIKNQRTLEEVARRPWRLLGPIELLSHSLELD